MTKTTIISEEKVLHPGSAPHGIFTMENHDNAYYTWKESNLKQKILIHIDAHHDIWFIQKDSQITIANFICKALEEDIVKEVFWIVPDKAWENSKTKNQYYNT